MKYYISCPVSVDYQQILLTEKLIKEKDSKAKVGYWDRRQFYYENGVKNCDTFIIILPDNEFSYKVSKLPSGVLREYNQARYLDRTIYLGYKSRTTGYMNIYNIKYSFDSGILQGIPGTGNNLFLSIQEKIQLEDLRKNTLTPEECYPVPTMQEKRLLLFLK